MESFQHKVQSFLSRLMPYLKETPEQKEKRQKRNKEKAKRRKRRGK